MAVWPEMGQLVLEQRVEIPTDMRALEASKGASAKTLLLRHSFPGLGCYII